MMGEYIFKTIKDNIPEVHEGGKYHIYPYVPETVIFEKGITYQMLNSETVYTMLGATYQINCFAKKYSDAEALAIKVSKLFQDKYITTQGTMLNTSSQGILQLPFDRDNNIYHFAVTIYLKTII